MRDAILLGSLKMLDLQKYFLTSEVLAGHFNFLHIVLTDGADNASKGTE